MRPRGLKPWGRINCVIAALAFLLLTGLGEPSWAREGQRAVESLIEIRHKNVVLQQWDLSCAAAALATVLRHQHGEPITERLVALGLIERREYLEDPGLVKQRQGFSLWDMKRYVELLGYQGVGLGHMTFDDLLESAPIIVPLKLRGYPHFVVFRGAAKNRVLVADPTFGNLTLTRAKFTAAWINYGDIGRVGFVVKTKNQLAPPGSLTPDAAEFMMLH